MAAARVLPAVGSLRGSNCGLLLRSHHSSARRLATPPRPRRLHGACRELYRPEVHIKEEGQPETLDYRVFFLDGSGKKVSPWHDIPLDLGDGVFNFVVEIPKGTSAKMEVATDEPFTPLK